MAAELQRLRAELRAELRTVHVPHSEVSPQREELLEQYEEPKIQVDLRMARDNMRNVMHANTFIRNMKGLVKN
eukprot:s825_g20.t1